MNNFVKLLTKSEKIIIGVLSGTSMDGVDVVLTKISGNNINTSVQVIDFYTNPYTEELKKLIIQSASISSSNVEKICNLNFYLGHFFAESINKIISTNKINAEKVDLIGSHGQTIYHIPVESEISNIKTKSTLQLGDPSVIANLTGVTTVGDFRVADVAVGGDGAPLVPFLDYIFFCSKDISRVLLNIGGISNLTYLKKGSELNEVIAFDTGPGNVLIDNLVEILFKKEYDKDGEIALSGKLDNDLLNYIIEKDSFIKKSPPKSTGREHYNKEFLDDILEHSKFKLPADIIRTVSEFTVFSIKYSINNFLKESNEISELIVSGGGALNKYIMNSLSDNLKGISVQKLNQKGITPENKEAVLFAVLANEAVQGNSANLMSVTNAKKNVVLGKICIAN